MAPLFFMKGDNMKKIDIFRFIAGGIILVLESAVLIHAGFTPFTRQWWAIMLLTVGYSCITCYKED